MALFIVYAFPPLEVSGSLRSRGFAEHLPNEGVLPVIVSAESESVASSYPGSVGWVEKWQDDPRWASVVRIPWSDNTATQTSWQRWFLRIPLLSTWIQRRNRNEKVNTLYEVCNVVVEKHRPSIVYCSVAPSTTALVGARLAERHRIPLVVDIRDPWSYGPSRPYRHYVDFLLERSVERRTLSKADLIVTPTRAAKQLIVRKLGVSANKIEVIPNGFEPQELHTHGPLEDGVFTILHAGEVSVDGKNVSAVKQKIKRTLGIDFDPMHRDYSTRSPNLALQALDTLFKKRPELRSLVRLRFVGIKDKSFKSKLKSFDCCDRVLMEPRVPRDNAESIMRRADALLLLQVSYWLDGRPFCPAVPAKLYSYLNTGKPVVAVAQRSELSELIEKEGTGRVVAPGDVDELVSVFEELVDRWLTGTTASRSWSDRENYTRAWLARRLARSMEALV